MTIALLKEIDRSRFEITLVLMRREGEYISDIPQDITVHALNQPSMWTMVGPTLRLLRRHHPDVIFSTSSGTNVLVCIAHLLGRQRGRLILSERNILFHGEFTAKRRFMVFLKRLFYSRADLITSISDCLKEDVVAKTGIDPRQIYVVYNPVVEDEIESLAQQPIDHPWFQADNDIPVILGVGRLVPQKDFPTLLRAFHLVRQRHPARLLILGEGPERPELEQLALSLGVADDVQIPGFDKNPFRYMARCAMFVQTPVHEGLGNVLIQAMACGRPVISTDCPCGPSEIITHPGEDGYLVPVGDVKATADKISYLLTHPEVGQRIGACAKVSSERFRSRAIMRRYINAITGDLENKII